MLRSRRHRRQSFGAAEPRPRYVLRLIIAALVLLIIWYLGNRVFSLFDDSVGRGTSAVLALEQGNGDGVQVSLQQGDWQRGENNLKMYPGDGVAARSGVHAILAFFDGSRVRLDQSSEVEIDRSDKVTAGQSSTMEMTLKSGRVWIATPNLAVYSGAIVRHVSTPAYTAEIPADASAMLASDGITVIKSSGVGLTVQLKNVKTGGNSQVIVGEGQMLTLNDDAKRQIAGGADPYTFRDPITPDSLKDDFLAKSYALLSNLTLPTVAAAGTGSVTLADGEDLTITAPANKQKVSAKSVTVSGKTSQRIRNVLVNGYDAPIKPDRTFSLDLALEDEESTTIHVEAQDPQGITLAEADRTVTRELKPFTPVKMTSPVASGGTLTTSLEEIEITGEAPAGTATIMVNDYKLQLYKPGAKTWSYLASVRIGNLIVGKNVFTIYALDTDGRKSTPTVITIVVDPNAAATVTPGTTPTSPVASSAASQPPLKQNPPLTPGTLAVTAPVAGTQAEVSDKEVVIEGTTSADTASISVNGYTLSLYIAGKTTWNYIASVDLTTMKEGKNVYRIVSRNKDGEILDVLEYTMTYKPN